MMACWWYRTAKAMLQKPNRKLLRLHLYCLLHTVLCNTHVNTHTGFFMHTDKKCISQPGCSLTYTHKHTQSTRKWNKKKLKTTKVTLCISVVGVCYAAESLLAGCIPDLHNKPHNYTSANVGWLNIRNNRRSKPCSRNTSLCCPSLAYSFKLT